MPLVGREGDVRINRPKASPDYVERVVPPGQLVTEKFPVLSISPTPRIDLARWRFRLFGLVEEEVELDWSRFMSLRQTAVTADFHCVTQWSRLGNAWQGVLCRDLLGLLVPTTEARFAMVHCYGGYTTNLPLGVLLDGEFEEQTSVHSSVPTSACPSSL